MFRILKQLLTLTVVAVIITTAIPVTIGAASGSPPLPSYWPPNPPEGRGWHDNPILINSAEDFIWLHEMLIARREHNAEYTNPVYYEKLGLEIKLTADITLPDNFTLGYTGNSSLPDYIDDGFYVDGNNHTITINNPNGYGLFTPYTWFTFKNVTIGGNIGSGAYGRATGDGECCMYDYDTSDCSICWSRVFESKAPYPERINSYRGGGELYGADANVEVKVNWWGGTPSDGAEVLTFEEPPEEELNSLDEMIHYVFHDHVNVVESEAFSYTTSDGILSVDFNHPNEVIDNLAVGDVFVIYASAQAPGGLSGHITNIEKNGDTLTITADIPTDLNEIFAELEINIESLYLLHHENVIVEMSPRLQGVEGVELYRNPTRIAGLTFSNSPITFSDDSYTAKLSGDIRLINPRDDFKHILGYPTKIYYASDYEIDVAVELSGSDLFGEFDEMIPLIKTTVPLKIMSLGIETGFRLRGEGTAEIEYAYRGAHFEFGWTKDDGACQNRQPGTWTQEAMTLTGTVFTTLYIQGIGNILGVGVYGIVGETGWRLSGEISTDYPYNSANATLLVRVSSADNTLLTHKRIPKWFEFEEFFYLSENEFFGNKPKFSWCGWCAYEHGVRLERGSCHCPVDADDWGF